MIDLNVEYGRLSEKYNHFKDYNLENVVATDTRLMGAVALCLNWESALKPGASFYQIIHLDYSEYGIDDYFEYECIKGEDGYSEKLDEIAYRWTHFTRVMGGSNVEISAEKALALIDEAIEVWNKSSLALYGEDINRDFREGAIFRISLMKEALNITPNHKDIIASVSPKRLTACETINYFLMRLLDRDFPAALYLTTVNPDKLCSCSVTQYGIQTLISNEIRSAHPGRDKEQPGTSCYSFKFISLADDSYYLGMGEIYLSGGGLGENKLISAFNIKLFQKLSSWESAMLVKRTEYITVYDVPDRILSRFDYSVIPRIRDAEPVIVGNGWQLTIYNSNNSHVDSNNYKLNNDIFGSALVSIPGELVLMSYNPVDIMLLENAVAISEYGPKLNMTGRYQVEDMVFQSLCESTGAMFKDMIVDED